MQELVGVSARRASRSSSARWAAASRRTATPRPAQLCVARSWWRWIRLIATATRRACSEQIGVVVRDSAPSKSGVASPRHGEGHAERPAAASRAGSPRRARACGSALVGACRGGRWSTIVIGRAPIFFEVVVRSAERPRGPRPLARLHVADLRRRSSGARPSVHHVLRIAS